ncbi:MAG TPA: class I SAM-dependent methyltransferase [Jatrophihabitans sp.]|nr:class I SAM-dependent methyltransferase [Jatrophihabitans sp.]
MSTESLPAEVAALQVRMWDGAYDASALGGQANLWGDPPVPYARTAAELFAAADAAVIMDLPCGDGRNLPPLAAGAPILLAGDTSPRAMRIARGVVQRAGVQRQVVFSETDAYATRLLDDSVDGIFCWDLLGHLTEPAGALTEFLRILRPGGCLIANQWTMNDCQVADDRAQMTEIGPKTYLDHADFYCKFYDEQDLAELLSAVSLQAESVRTASWWEPPHPGYRDYVHRHESLIFHVRKPA